MQKLTISKRNLRKRLRNVQRSAIHGGLDEAILQQFSFVTNYNYENKKGSNRKLVVTLVAAFIFLAIFLSSVNGILGARCLLPSNYLVWESTRPIAECSYCADITKPIILSNITRLKFTEYAYSSKPIIVKNAIKHWRAVKEFSYEIFMKLYEETEGSYESLEDGCQFLNFKTDLFTLKEVFTMPNARAKNEPGQKPWYVGWGNCHPSILSKVRQYYSIPDFLPEDAEFPATENIFFGYEIGAVMHLDYIPRLMWQGQIKGKKIWFVAPVPECEHVCHKFEYYVEPGDVVLLDTRLWYHSTSIPRGQFAMTVQSEYG